MGYRDCFALILEQFRGPAKPTARVSAGPPAPFLYVFLNVLLE